MPICNINSDICPAKQLAQISAFGVDDLDEFGLAPDALDDLAVAGVELAEALNAVVVEVALEDLAAGQLDLPPSLLRVPHQHALVVLPVVLQQFEVGEVEGEVEGHGVVVVDLARPVELVLGPAALVGEFAALVVESALAVHLVVAPLPLVVAAVLVVELPPSVPHAAALEPLVPAARLVLLHHVLFPRLLVCLRTLGVQWRVLVPHLHDGRVVFVLGGRTVGSVWGFVVVVLDGGGRVGLGSKGIQKVIHSLCLAFFLRLQGLMLNVIGKDLVNNAGAFLDGWVRLVPVLYQNRAYFPFLLRAFVVSLQAGVVGGSLDGFVDAFLVVGQRVEGPPVGLRLRDGRTGHCGGRQVYWHLPLGPFAC